MGWGAAAAGAGAIGNIAGSILGGNAAKSASAAQAKAAYAAQYLQQAQWQQSQNEQLPFVNAGFGAMDTLRSTLGLNGGNGQNLLKENGINGLTFQPTQAQLEATPGYQFDLNQGLQGVANSDAAKGRGISGAALKGAAGYATGLANNTLATQQGIFQQNLGNVLNPLTHIADLGANEAAGLGAQGIQASGNIAQSGMAAGNAIASGIVGSANNIGSALGTAGSSPLNTMLYQQLLGQGGGGGNGFFGSGNTSNPNAAGYTGSNDAWVTG